MTSKIDINKLCHYIHSKFRITTSDEIYEGLLKFISISTGRVIFEHVYQHPSQEYLGTVHICLSSILSWTLLEPSEKNFNSSNFDSSEELLKREFSKNDRIDYSETINIPPGKHFIDYLHEHLKKSCPSDFRFIDSVNADYDKAIKDLSESTNIGLSCHGPKISRCGILTWMCLSTSTCVFIFDIERLGKSAFDRGLKEILENEKIEKVVHDCREVTDCLLHLFDTNMKSIFDTQAADYVINMQFCSQKRIFKYVNSLDSCLSKYLKVPQQFLYNRNKSVTYNDEVQFYNKRPISKDFLNVLLKSSMYLILLMEEQKKALMSPYERAVELSLNYVRSASDAEVHMMLSEDIDAAPSYLRESVKPIRFYDMPQPEDDSLNQSKDSAHTPKGKEHYKKLLKDNCDLPVG